MNNPMYPLSDFTVTEHLPKSQLPVKDWYEYQNDIPTQYHIVAAGHKHSIIHMDANRPTAYNVEIAVTDDYIWEIVWRDDPNYEEEI